jgi:hypothetical protein
MDNFRLPDSMKQPTLANFWSGGFGWVAYVNPSAMFADERRHLWLDPEAEFREGPDDVKRMRVERIRNGLGLVVYRVPDVLYKVGSRDSPAKVVPVVDLKNDPDDPSPLPELEEDY